MNITNIIVSLALALCDVVLLRYYLNNDYKRIIKYKNQTIALEIFVFFAINVQILPDILNYLLFISILFVIIRLYNLNIRKQISTIFILILITIIVENILILFFGWVFDMSTSIHVKKHFTPQLILIKVLTRYLYYLIIINLTNKRSKDKKSLHNFKWISLFISIYFSLTVILLDDTLFYFPNIGRTFVFIVIVYNFALIMFDRYQRKAEATEKEFIITKQRIEDDKKYLIKTEVAHDEMRAFRHDLTNKLSIISSHIQRDEKDIALKHLEEMGVTIASNKAKIYIGDPSVDSIIDARVDDMLSKGITFEESYGLICIGRIDSYDLALLFALALDNAIEAVERITEGEKRISLDIHTQREFLYINIENTFISKGKNDFTRTSKKTNIESHGFGVKKMKSLVNKYDGLMDYHFNGNSVMLKIVLNNNYIKENV